MPNPVDGLIEDGYVLRESNAGKMPDLYVSSKFLELPTELKGELLRPVIEFHFDDGYGYLRILEYPSGVLYGTYSRGGFNIRHESP